MATMRLTKGAQLSEIADACNRGTSLAVLGRRSSGGALRLQQRPHARAEQLRQRDLHLWRRVLAADQLRQQRKEFLRRTQTKLVRLTIVFSFAPSTLKS